MVQYVLNAEKCPASIVILIMIPRSVKEEKDLRYTLIGIIKDYLEFTGKIKHYI